MAKVKHVRYTLLTFILLGSLWSNYGQSNTLASPQLTFDMVLALASANDPWLQANEHQQRALIHKSIQANTLADPKMSIGLANLPSDGFDFNQEAMTQVKIGLSQQFARGDSLALTQQKLKLQSQAYPYLRQARQEYVRLQVGKLWLDAYLAQQRLVLLKEKQQLYQELIDLNSANYRTTVGHTRQKSLLQAQLSLSRLAININEQQQLQRIAYADLSQWLLVDTNKPEYRQLLKVMAEPNPVATQLPELQLPEHSVITSSLNHQFLPSQSLVTRLSRHPSVLAINKKIAADKLNVDLAQQQYKSQWGVNVSYGYRDNDALNRSRSDFLSASVTFDLPLFTENKQDQGVKSALAANEAIRTEKLLTIRELYQQFALAKAHLSTLTAREKIYEEQLLPQIKVQMDAVLGAYTHNDGEYADVVETQIALNSARADMLALAVKQLKQVLAIQYVFAQTDEYHAQTKGVITHVGK